MANPNRFFLTTARQLGLASIAAAFLLSFPAASGAANFKRGDSNADGVMDLSDALQQLGYLFLGEPEPGCLDSADSNDDGEVNIGDPIYGLEFLFLGGSEPPAPGSECGPDPSADELDCDVYPPEVCSSVQENQPPQASFTSNPYLGDAPLVVRFDASGAADPDGTIIKYTWDYGDGSSGQGISVEHTYTEAGEYAVELTVTDNRGASAAAAGTVTVKIPIVAVEPTLEEQVHFLTNQVRSELGLPPLKHQAQLQSAMRAHCEEMAENDYLSHDSLDGRPARQRISAAGYEWSSYAENIARGYPTAEAVVLGWLGSSGHRANMLNAKYRELGVGYAHTGSNIWEHYWGQDFGVRSEVYPMVIDLEAVSTSSQEVSLYIYGSGWAQEMQVSNDPSFEGASWQPYRSNLTWTLSPGYGLRTVHVRLRNNGAVKTAEDSIYRVNG